MTHDAITKDQMAWAVGGDTGISSLTIWSVMTGIPSATAKRNGHSEPLDPDDFGRCWRLLQRFPEWRARLPEVSAAHPHWTPLVARWADLEALWGEETAGKSRGTAPRLYALMCQLRGVAA